MQNSFVRLLLVVIVLASLGLVGFVTNSHLTTKATSQRNAAIDNCGQMARVTYKTSDGAEVTHPEEVWYRKCLSEKKLN